MYADQSSFSFMGANLGNASHKYHTGLRVLAVTDLQRRPIVLLKDIFVRIARSVRYNHYDFIALRPLLAFVHLHKHKTHDLPF